MRGDIEGLFEGVYGVLDGGEEVERSWANRMEVVKWETRVWETGGKMRRKTDGGAVRTRETVRRE